MMDHERQERDLQGVFDAIQVSYLASIENTFVLKERTLLFARVLIEASEEILRTQAEDNRAMLAALTEESRRQREAMEKEATQAPEVQPRE